MLSKAEIVSERAGVAAGIDSSRSWHGHGVIGFGLPGCGLESSLETVSWSQQCEQFLTTGGAIGVSAFAGLGECSMAPTAQQHSHGPAALAIAAIRAKTKRTQKLP